MEQKIEIEVEPLLLSSDNATEREGRHAEGEGVKQEIRRLSNSVLANKNRKEKENNGRKTTSQQQQQQMRNLAKKCREVK